MRFMLFQILWALFTLTVGLVAMLLLPSACASKWVARVWNVATLWLAWRVGGMRIQLSGLEHRPKGAAVYASKHQSSLDTFALWLALDNPAFVLKRSLLFIPVFGWFLARMRPIAVNRAAGKQAIEQIAAQGAAKLAQGRNLVIFPQGTRQPIDQAPQYKSGGVAALYALGYPVVPVALNTGKLWPKNGRKRAGAATIAFAPALPQGLSKPQLMQQLQADCDALG